MKLQNYVKIMLKYRTECRVPFQSTIPYPSRGRRDISTYIKVIQYPQLLHYHGMRVHLVSGVPRKPIAAAFFLGCIKCYQTIRGQYINNIPYKTKKPSIDCFKLKTSPKANQTHMPSLFKT